MYTPRGVAKEAGVRKWLLVPIILVVVLVIGLFVARATLTPDRVRALVETRLEAALRRPVELGAIRIRTLPLSMRVENVALTAPDGFASRHLLHIGTLELEPRLLPLLSRRIVVRSVRIDAPEIWVEQRADSVWNWALEPPDAGAVPAPGQRAGTGADWSIESLEVEGGRVHLDAIPAALALVVPVDAHIALGADRAQRDVRLSGWITADSIRGNAGALRDLRWPRLRFEPEVQLDVPESTATVERLRVIVNRAAIDVTGSARLRGGKPELHLATRSEAVDLAELLDALPAGATGAAAGLVATGTVRFDVQSDIVPGARPVVHGSVSLAGGTLRAARLPEPVSDLDLRLQLAGDSLRIEDLSARLGDAPVRVHGLIAQAWQPQRTRYDVQVTAALDLGRASRVVPLPPGVTLAGHADVDVRARGRTARPDSVAVDGPIALRDVVVQTPQLRQPLHADARLRGAGPLLRVESARVTAGRSALDLTGAVWPALPPGRPRVELQGRTARLDLVELLVEAAPQAASGADSARARAPRAATLVPVLPAMDARVTLTAGEVVLHGSTLEDVDLQLRSDGRTAQLEARARTLRTGDTILYDAVGTLEAANRSGTGRVRAARATLHKLEATQLESDVAVEGQSIRLPTMRARAYSGTLRGTSVLDLAVPTRPRYEIEANVDDVQFASFLGAFAPLGNAVTGTLDMTSNWKFAGPGPATLRQTLSAGGKASSTDGRIADLPLLRDLAALLQLPSLNAIPYRDLGLQFAIDSGRLSMREAIVHARDADFGLGGSVGLDGSLDLALQITLSQDLTRRALGSRTGGALTSLFTDASGRLVFDVGVGGTHRAPKLALDLQKTAGRAGAAALTENVLRRVLGDKLPSLPIPGAPAGRTDSAAVADPGEELRRRAVEEARKRLGGKLGGLLGGASADSAAPRP